MKEIFKYVDSGKNRVVVKRGDNGKFGLWSVTQQIWVIGFCPYHAEDIRTKKGCSEALDKMP